MENKIDIEKEVQARVEFKINEILTAVGNKANLNWNIAFSEKSSKHENYWQAFSELKQIIRKEIDLPVPFDEMNQVKFQQKKNEMVDKFSNLIELRGSRDNQIKIRKLVSLVEECLNFQLFT